jgi:uncharacterized protein (TIGR01244 family)
MSRTKTPWASRVLACLAAALAAAALSCAAVPPAVLKADLPGIQNFSRIDGSSGFAGPVAGFGGATQPAAMPALKSAGFATVISLRLASEEGAEVDANRDAAQAAGLNYLHIPFEAENPDPAVIDAFLAALGNPANQPVYIHCNSATRVAALWMIGRVLLDGWESDAAASEAELIAAKPDVAIAFATRYIDSRRE